jgi:hypothetical protein
MAKQIILDLNFRVLSPTQQIFIAFPGKGYGLYSRFYALNRVFPQLPGIDLFPKRSFEEQPELLATGSREPVS